MFKTWGRYIIRPKDGATRECSTRVFLVGVRVAYGSEVELLMVGTLQTSHISIRVNLVGLLMLHFILSIGVSLVMVIILTRQW